MLEAIAAASWTTAVAGVEAEGARGVLALLRARLGCEELANAVKGADIACRVRACRTTDRGLIDHHDVVDEIALIVRQ